MSQPLGEWYRAPPQPMMLVKQRLVFRVQVKNLQWIQTHPKLFGYATGVEPETFCVLVLMRFLYIHSLHDFSLWEILLKIQDWKGQLECDETALVDRTVSSANRWTPQGLSTLLKWSTGLYAIFTLGIFMYLALCVPTGQARRGFFYFTFSTVH